MITLNEEQHIGQTLCRVKPYFDELIVVDGGSADRTVELAERAGAKVYHHRWVDHFAKQRNHSLKYASGDWIVQMDPDETFSLPLLRSLRGLMDEAGRIDLYIFREKHYLDGRLSGETRQMKMFRNNGKIRFKRRLHEYLIGWEMAGYPRKLLVHHYKTSRRHATQHRRYARLERRYGKFGPKPGPDGR